MLEPTESVPDRTGDGVQRKSGPTIEHRVLAARLLHAREAAQVTREQAARALGAHAVTVRRIELGETTPRVEQLDTLLECYRLPDGERKQLLDQLLAATRPGWWHAWADVLPEEQQEWIGLESSASLIRIWAPTLLPDLLHTPDYTAALHRHQHPHATAAARDRAVELVQQRQQHTREAKLWVLLHEAALHTTVGDPEVMRRQHAALHEQFSQPRVTIQCLPLTAPPTPLTGCGPLRLLRVPPPEVPDHLVLEEPGRPALHSDEATLSAWRLALDTTAVTAPAPGADLPTTPHSPEVSV